MTSGNKNASDRKETVAVSATNTKIVRKNQNTLLPSQPFHEVEVSSKKRSIRGKSNHGSILRQPCSCYLRRTCTRTPCEQWHPPECQFYKTETGCKSGDTCLFPHFKVDEQPNERPKKGYFTKKEEKTRTKALWLLRKAYHKWVVYHKIQTHSFLKVGILGEARCRKS